jgi:hypothetical protein
MPKRTFFSKNIYLDFSHLMSYWWDNMQVQPYIMYTYKKFKSDFAVMLRIGL